MEKEENELLEVRRPEPIVAEIVVFIYNQKMNYREAIDALLEGHYVIVEDYFSTGLSLLKKLKEYITIEYPEKSFKGQRDFRSIYYDLSNRILLNVSNNELTVKKAPDIGWLKKLYPDISEFALPFPKVQGLNSAWQWYKKGLSTPVLREKIYPYYGSYFPTRFDHIELFDSWLRRYKGGRELVYDVGIGSGILSFQMLKYSFERIIGTDNNPNSIIGLEEAIKRNRKYTKIEPYYGNLFAENEDLADLIVFNPPWLPADKEVKDLDVAVYYNTDLFPAFFEEAKKHLKREGKVVILFSNLAKITNYSHTNPIQEEVMKGGRFKKELFLKRSVKQASQKTKRDQNWRSKEIVELWVLGHA